MQKIKVGLLIVFLGSLSLYAESEKSLQELKTAGQTHQEEDVEKGAKYSEYDKDLQVTTGLELKALQAIIPIWCTSMVVIAVFVVGREVMQKLEHN